jgi:hypothetical protein
MEVAKKHRPISPEDAPNMVRRMTEFAVTDPEAPKYPWEEFEDA